MADRDNIIADSRHQRGTQLLFAKRYYPVLVSKRSRIRILSIERQWANILFFGHRLTFNFVPKMGLIYRAAGICLYNTDWNNTGFIWATGQISANVSGRILTITQNGKTLTWYSGEVYSQFNASGVVYYFVFIG